MKSPLPQLVKVVLTCGLNAPLVFIMGGSTIYRRTKKIAHPEVDSRPKVRMTGLPVILNPKRPILGLSHLLDGRREPYCAYRRVRPNANARLNKNGDRAWGC